MGRLADILVEEEFDVTVLQPSLTMDLVSIKDVQKAKLVTVPQAPGVNEGWAKTWSQFRNPWVHEPQFVKLLASAGHFATQCNYTIQQTDIIEQLKAEKFDVCLTEMFDHCGIVLMNLLGCKSKIITASTVSMESINPHIGVPNIYSYVPISVAKGTDKMNLKTKIGSIITMLGLRYYYYQFRKEMDKVIGYNFGAEHQLTADLVGESDLLFANSHPALDFAKPSLEKIIDIGGISLPTPKPLDQEWKDLVAKRKKTVFVSFGSVARSIWMPVEWRDSILDAMKQFPDVTFIWKYEKPEDNFTASAPNVKLTAWGPQLDLLASGKIDLFVSHGGLGSVYETSLSGVPAIFVPLFADQFRNAYMCQAKGFAEVATKDRLIDTKFLVDMLGKMLNDDKYKTSAMETARRMKSRPFSSRELFVKWTKFAASEGRLDFLDPAGRKMGFFEYFSLDVVAIFLSAITVVLLVVYLIAISPLKLIKTPVIIATWAACCGYYFAVEFAIAFSIVYYAQALHYSISTGGIFAMIALILLLLIKILTGQLSDKLHHISELTRMRIFNSVALFGSSVFFIIASFWEPNGSWMDIAVIVLPVCILGVHSGGYPKCVVIVAKQHSPTVFAYMQLLGCAILVAGSFVVPAMTPTGSHQEWAQVFRIYAAVLVVSNMIFCYWASAEPCEWTKAKPEQADVEAPPPSQQSRRPSETGSTK
ncbi:unnamed protein product, partial [Mesorhabditis spiculigera]